MSLRCIEGVDIMLHVYLTSALMEVSGQLHALAVFTLQKRCNTHWTGGSVGSRADTDGATKDKNPVPAGYQILVNKPSSQLLHIQHVFRVIRLLSLRLVGHVTRMGQEGIYKNLLAKQRMKKESYT
jgi:hypothetical protein